MSDLNDSSVGFEAELLDAKRLINNQQLQLENKDNQIEALKGLHEADLKKLNGQVRNLTAQLEEVVNQKIEGDKRHQTLIDQLGVKNRDLNIELNNTIQKYQLEIQKQRGSFAKRSSVIAVAMLNKLSHPGLGGVEDRSARPSRVSSPANKRPTAEDKSPKTTAKDPKANPFKDSEGLKKLPTITVHHPSPLPHSHQKQVDELTENSVSDNHSAMSFGSSHPKKENTENIEEMIRQIAPSLPGLGPKNAALMPSTNHLEILKIIEELQYMLKCEEIEKKQILAEHTQTLEKMANLEHAQLDIGCKFFALEREKVEALHQMDIYKNISSEYEGKWKDLMLKQSKIEVRMSQIRNDKAMDQGELELLKAEVGSLKAKTCDLQLQLNEKDYTETENYRDYQRAKSELSQKLNQTEATTKLIKNELEKRESENKTLTGQLAELEKQVHQANFQVAKAEEIELQYTAMIQGLNQTIEKLSRELALHGMNGGVEALENVSEERLAFSERDSLDEGLENHQAFERLSHSSLIHNSREAIMGGSGRSGSVDGQKDETDSLRNDPINSRPNSMDKKLISETGDAKLAKTGQKNGRTSLMLNDRNPTVPSTTFLDGEKRPSNSKLETLASFTGNDTKVFSTKDTTNLNIFSIRKKADPTSKTTDNTDKPSDAPTAAKKEPSSKPGIDKRHSLVSGSNHASSSQTRRQSVRNSLEMINTLANSNSNDIIKKRMDELNSASQKESEWTSERRELQDQLQKLSADLNLRIEEVFTVQKALRDTQEKMQQVTEELRLKTLKVSQLEEMVRESEGEGQSETNKLREHLEEVTHSLVDFKLRFNDLQSKSDIQKNRLQKQIKIRDYELDILRREIYKFNTNELDD